jgi:hypothetical protein
LKEAWRCRSLAARIPSSSFPATKFNKRSVRYQAGIRVGHRHDVASDIVEADVQLRIRGEDFDNDRFLSVSKIRDISKLVGDEFEKRYPSLLGSAC